MLQGFFSLLKRTGQGERGRCVCVWCGGSRPPLWDFGQLIKQICNPSHLTWILPVQKGCKSWFPRPTPPGGSGSGYRKPFRHNGDSRNGKTCYSDPLCLRTLHRHTRCISEAINVLHVSKKQTLLLITHTTYCHLLLLWRHSLIYCQIFQSEITVFIPQGESSSHDLFITSISVHFHFRHVQTG